MKEFFWSVSSEATSSFEATYIQVHEHYVYDKHPAMIDAAIERISCGSLRGEIERTDVDFTTKGTFIAVRDIAALFEYGTDGSVLMHSYEDHALDVDHSQPDPQSNRPSLTAREAHHVVTPEIKAKIGHASHFAFSVLLTALKQPRQKRAFALIHVMLTFVRSLIDVKTAMSLFGADIPWHDVCRLLNIIKRPDSMMSGNGKEVHLSYFTSLRYL